MKGPGLALICALLMSAALPLVGKSAALAADAHACGAAGPLTYVCGATNVEDMVQVPGTRWLVGSSMRLGKAVAKDGVALYLIDTRAKTATPATITLGLEAQSGPFAGCPAPDLAHMGTHGLELRAGTGGRHTLYAIDHGGRETIEVFEVEAAAGAVPKIRWTGCIRSPANTWLNSIASLPGGGLAISKFEDLDKIDMGPVFRGETTGVTYIWRPESGFTVLKGGEFSGNNGLLASKDGKTLWINDQGRSRLVRLAIDGSQPPAYAVVAFRPDNLRWAPDGSILAAGQVIDAGNPSLATANGWGVARIDPLTMAATAVMNEPGRPDFSNGTVALQVGKTLWLGTFRGDRIAYAEMK